MTFTAQIGSKIGSQEKMFFALIPICLQVGGSEVILLMFSDRFAVKLTEQKYARKPLGTVGQSSKKEDNSTGI